DSAAGKALGEDLGPRRVQPAEALLDPGGVGRGREKGWEHRAQRGADGDSPIGTPDSDVHMEAEGVVAPGHVLEPSLHTAVMLGVDDPLLLPGAPRMGARRPEHHPLPRDQLEQAVPTLLLASNGVREVRTLAGPDLYLRRDQLSGNRFGQHFVSLRELVQLLELADNRKVLRIEQPELFLEPDGEVGRLFEDLPRLL